MGNAKSKEVTAADTPCCARGRRTAYFPLALRRFGYIGDLTQAGTGANSELMSNSMRSNSPTHRA